MSTNKKRKSNEINITPLQRSYNVRSASVNEEARTFEVVAATETPVRVDPYWDDAFNEVLVMSSMRTDRLDSNSVSFLRDHNSYSINNVMGKVIGYRVEGSELICTVQMSEREEFEGVWKDIKSGVLSNISVGYRVFKYQAVPMSDNDDIQTYRAIDWEPNEVSLVAVPADVNSGVRSENVKENKLLIEDNNMEEDGKPVEGQRSTPTPAPETTPVNEGLSASQRAEIQEQARVAERNRISGIRDKVRSLGLDESVAQTLIDENLTVEQASVRAIEEWAKKGPAPASNNVNLGADESEKLRSGASAHLIMRSSQNNAKANLTDAQKEHARQFNGMSLLDLAKDSLERAGYNPRGMSKDEIMSRTISSHSTDFPILLEGALRNVLLSEYSIQPDVWRGFCSIGSVSDFREYKQLRSGSFTDLDDVQENGEYKTKPITDGEFEKYSVKTVGNLINVSRTMIVNDDLGAFLDLAAKLGRASARTIENTVFRVLQLNGGNGPILVDGNPIFHASHNNIATTAGVPSTAVFEAMRVQVREVTDKDGNDYVNINPSTGLFPDAILGQANVVNGSEFDHDADSDSSKPNIVRGMLKQLIGTPRFTNKQAYYFFDPSNPVLQVSFLDGQETPFMDSMAAFKQDGVSWKVRHDFGVNGIGYRGAIKNAGA